MSIVEMSDTIVNPRTMMIFGRNVSCNLIRNLTTTYPYVKHIFARHIRTIQGVES